MKHLVKSVFLGQSTSIMVCKNCNNINQNHEDFSTLDFQVKNQKDIYDSLKNMVAGEIIQDYACSNCNQKVELNKKSAIRRLPNTLICHLNRIVFDFDSLRNVKLNDKFEFPNVLNVQEFMLPNVMRDIRKPSDAPDHQQENSQDVDMENKNEDAKEMEQVQESN